jgi:hypothetical protein
MEWQKSTQYSSSSVPYEKQIRKSEVGLCVIEGHTRREPLVEIIYAGLPVVKTIMEITV